MKKTVRLTGDIARTFALKGRVIEFGGQPFTEFVLPRVKTPVVQLAFKGRFEAVPQARIPFLQEV